MTLMILTINYLSWWHNVKVPCHNVPGIGQYYIVHGLWLVNRLHSLPPTTSSLTHGPWQHWAHCDLTTLETCQESTQQTLEWQRRRTGQSTITDQNIFTSFSWLQDTEGQATYRPEEGAGWAGGLHAGALLWGAELQHERRHGRQQAPA